MKTTIAIFFCVLSSLSYAVELKSKTTSGIEGLELLADRSDRLESLLGDRAQSMPYREALAKYLGDSVSSCSRADAVLKQAYDLSERLKGFKEIAWKKSAAEKYEFKFPSVKGNLVLHRVIRPFNAMMLFGHPTKCGVKTCDAKDGLLVDQWTMALMGAKLYVLEMDGKYTGMHLALLPVQLKDKKYLLAVPNDPSGVLQKLAPLGLKENALTEILNRVVGSKSYLGNLALLEQVAGSSRYQVYALSSQGDREGIIEAADRFRLSDPMAAQILAVVPRSCKGLLGRGGEPVVGEGTIADAAAAEGVIVGPGGVKAQSLSLGKEGGTQNSEESFESSESKKNSGTIPGPGSASLPGGIPGKGGNVGNGQKNGFGGVADSGDNGELYGEIPTKKREGGVDPENFGSNVSGGGRGLAEFPASNGRSGSEARSGGRFGGRGDLGGNAGSGTVAGESGNKTNITITDRFGGGNLAGLGSPSGLSGGASGGDRSGNGQSREGAASEGGESSAGSGFGNGGGAGSGVGGGPGSGSANGAGNGANNSADKELTRLIAQLEPYKNSENYINGKDAKKMLTSISQALTPNSPLENKAIDAMARSYLRSEDGGEVAVGLSEMLKEGKTSKWAQKVIGRVNDFQCCYCGPNCPACRNKTRPNCEVN